MRYTILSEFGPQRRWIKLGTFTHSIDGAYCGKDSTGQITDDRHYLATDLNKFGPDRDQGNKLISFVSLDAANFLGKNYESLTKALNSIEFTTVYIVGDLGVSLKPIPHVPKVKLLYSQKYSRNIDTLRSALHSHGFWEGIAHGIYPGFFYGCKDLATHPLRVANLLANKRSVLLFGGQDGSHSIFNIFIQHEEKTPSRNSRWWDTVSCALTRLAGEIEIQPSVRRAANLIVNSTIELSGLLENTEYALMQSYLKEQRNTILFKSIFRFALLRLLVRMGLLTVIAYPAEYVRIYNSRLYRRYLFLDFGGVNGYERIYPRVADMIYNGLAFFQFDQERMLSCQRNLSIDQVAGFIDVQLNELKFCA